MAKKAEELRREAKNKFRPYYKKLTILFSKIKGFFFIPLKKLREKFPSLPSFSSISKKIADFNFLRFLYTKKIESARKRGDSRKAELFTEKLKALDEPKKNVLVKYICRELFLYFMVCFLFFFVIFFVNQILVIAERILKQRVPLKIVLKILFYYLPNVVAQAAPFATLVGFLMCLGRMATDNEIMIIRASGQRYSKILIPVIFMGLFISAVSFVVNDYFLPLGNIKYNRLMKQAIAQNPAVELESNSIKRMNDMTLVIGDVTDSHASDLVFFDLTEAAKPRIIIAGGTDVEKTSESGVLMSMNMEDAKVIFMQQRKAQNFDVLSSEKMKLNIFETSVINSNDGVNPREMTSYDLKKKMKEMKESSSFNPRLLNNYQVEFDRKFTIPFGSIFFAILAFPLALIFGKKDGQTLGMIFGIIISVLYWCATMLTQMFGLRGGYYNFFFIWGPNLILGVVGVFLYLRLRRK